MRRRTRDAMTDYHLMEKMVRDIQTLFARNGEPIVEANAVYLWDDKVGQVENGHSYGTEGQL